MTADPEARLRADARRNRDQILAAAKAMFVEAGPDVPMEEIARRAGVGVGTLYRRFPDRDALIRAVGQGNFAEVLAEAEAATEEPTAWEALVRLLSRSRSLRLSVQLALLSPQAWAIIKADPETQRLRDSILDVISGLVTAAQEEGSLRRDVGAGDIAVLVALLIKPMPAPEHLTDLVTDRVLNLILDGLRLRPGPPLPGAPLSPDDLLLS
ncbi:AcrR family transcriptional regulator [Amycolatopsis bartoniae]|uniref:TetR family transcriptional regulator n=1 Tax=Amycolatopsis bartoniae TaxID=941986 RepID=A0A8H9M8U5_9PSEU|nr:TetR/AcrR family transcriptional regulator [Amycolatopsis bartoniae]MBB2937416.1 AcrR family transcriptional regulator [Amycolatopsis bartoniae]TVS99673.1 TetR/AcrR family transcriptional regulator [Amycolatopsis bartoniae]GHF86632.1 TetR family transcriptional regulator [Amycolatopsis bartoniae]